MRAKLLILTFLALVIVGFAIPTMPGIWRTAKLADGTEIRLEQVGDENLHYWRDVRGVCYNVDDEGVATPIANIGAVRAKAATRIAQNNARRAAAATRTVGISRRHVGKRKGLILLVNFTDVRFHPATPSLCFREWPTRWALPIKTDTVEACTTTLKTKVTVCSILLSMW